MDFVQVSDEPLDRENIIDMVNASSCGATCVFIGTPRDNSLNKRVISLLYEAYEEMALKQMHEICDQMRSKWPDVENIAIYHRVGMVKVCEPSVIIAISSPHSNEAFNAVEYAIRELKAKVPIWKKEVYADSQTVWKGFDEFAKLQNFDISMCSVMEDSPVTKDFIQISANEEEINRRIQCFVQKKREEIDFNNIMDFTEKYLYTSYDHNEDIADEEEELTCARTNAVVIKQDFAKCHLKVRRVNNHIGPQIRPDYLQTLDKLRENHSIKTETPTITNKNPQKIFPTNANNTNNDVADTFLDRLESIEEYLNMPPAKVKIIQQRIKNIEKRLLHLESLSPEYKHFLEPKVYNSNSNNSADTAINRNNSNLPEHKTYSVDDIDDIIASLLPTSSQTESSCSSPSSTQ